MKRMKRDPLKMSDGSVIRFCPFCGSVHVKAVKRLSRCEYCWRVFLLSYTRQMKGKSPMRELWETLLRGMKLSRPI